MAAAVSSSVVWIAWRTRCTSETQNPCQRERGGRRTPQLPRIRSPVRLFPPNRSKARCAGRGMLSHFASSPRAEVRHTDPHPESQLLRYFTSEVSAPHFCHSNSKIEVAPALRRLAHGLPLWNR